MEIAMSCFQPHPFKTRRIVSRGLVECGDWRLKRYDVLFDADRIDDRTYAGGLALAIEALPCPAATSARPGVGFVICHHGRGVHYIVLSWWDNENELFQRVLTRGFNADAIWQDGAGKGSFCVWDAEIIWAEREAYVRHVLTESPDLDAYLAVRLGLAPTGASAPRGST
jgi:hypothetical protein